MPEPSISVVVTNYNTATLTIRCVEGVMRHKQGRPVEVVVVDDGSSESLRGRLPAGVELVENGANRGYLPSVNIGVARARGDVVLLLDSDAEPLADVFTPVARAFGERPRLGAVGYPLVDRADQPTGATAPEPTALGLAVGQQLEARLQRWVPALFSDPFTINSCAIAFRRRAFEDLGGFDEGFDFLDGDTDFSMRLRRAGWELDIERGAKILHEGSGSPQTTARRVLRFHTNRWRLLEKHGRLPYPTLLKGVLWARHLAELAVIGGSSLAGGDPIRRADKLESRKKLLATVWHAYRGAGPR